MDGEPTRDAPADTEHERLDVWVVQKPFLNFKGGERITQKDIGKPVDIDRLLRLGVLKPMRAGPITLKGSMPSWGDLLSDIEEMSNKIASLQHENTRLKAEAGKTESEALQAASEQMVEMARELKRLHLENAELRLKCGVTEASATPTEQGKDADTVTITTTDVGTTSAGSVLTSTPLKPQPQPARTQGNKLKIEDKK